ncbi:MAG TPA: DegT/DnrJ/EryC1/StrS family aminotransferase [Candidatus Woesebacteria bacterium]|nr:DegT/DnrJ/EryC1/StrS family aminotransferase [Candidatus Woesebacteria bacterium]
MINIAKPLLNEKEEQAVIAVLRSGNLAQGEKVAEFEKKFSSYIGTKYAVATSNGTTALHLALLSLDLSKGDEIITSPFSFIASANTAIYSDVIPVFADINPKTFNIDPDLIESKITRKTKVIIPVHLYGLPAEMYKIKKIAEKHNIKIVEDACQAHGAKIKNNFVGSIGDLACFSFYPTKNMTTGEGGIITTNNKLLAERLRLLRSHGMKKRYHHSYLGYNFRMTDIAAAIGIEQLKKLNKFNKIRILNANLYIKYLSKTTGIDVPLIPKNFHHVFHQFTIRINSKYPLTRDQVIEKLKKNGIGSEIYYPIPIHKQIFYKKMGYKESYPYAEKASKEVLSLPIHPGLTKEEIMKVIEILS